MTNKIRASINVPDHEVLRKVGGGAYGEVWLARGVTGAWRAVKVVWREDFEDERGFEREFDGILQYEPISRDHPALVNVLHVGRSSQDGEPFYYYVMELGDDFHTGVEINAVEYEARTLRSDLVTADGKPLDIDFCLEVAIRLAEALTYLHDRGLAHRDVKPSNVIFVGGKAKLADIGLVAPRDQRTFVGTEGFVPPEGPGSAQADLYSLGKVLYEMLTGKDRLQFPELPDELPAGDKRKLWLAMNQLICDICEPHLSKRKITSAKVFAESVRRLQQGKKVRFLKASSIFKTVGALCLFGVAGGLLVHYQPWNKQPVSVVSSDPAGGDVMSQGGSNEPKGPVNALCSVKINTTPPFALVYENGQMLDGITPIDFREFKPGEVVRYKFELEGYRTKEIVYTVLDQDIDIIHETLEIYRPPVENVAWIGPQGMEYSPREGFHVSGLLRSAHYASYLKAANQQDQAKRIPYSESGEGIEIVLLAREVAEDYAKWLEKTARESGLLTEEHMVEVRQDFDLAATDFTAQDKTGGVLPTRFLVKKIPYSSALLKSVPASARVYVQGKYMGLTPLALENLRPGELSFELHMEGYQKLVKNVTLGENEDKHFELLMRPNDGVVFDAKWKNSLEMQMVPVREGLMASVWETRVKDYQEFVKATGHRAPKRPGFRQGDNHPVVGVSRADAEAFCKWLTEKERKLEKIGEGHRYKLPSDLEWSALVDLSEDAGSSPSERDLQAQNDENLVSLFPWGREFPPVPKLANLADESAALAVGVAKSRTITGYKDGFEKTAPVGSFKASDLGIYDLSGNAYEWVSSSYKEGSTLAVARGGSWASFSESHLRVWSRFLLSSSMRGNQFGFRVVLIDETENSLE